MRNHIVIFVKDTARMLIVILLRLAMSRRAVAAAAAASAFIGSPSAAAAAYRPTARVTPIIARNSAYLVFENYAGALGEKLVIAPCRPVGKWSRACNVRVGVERFRLQVRYADRDMNIRAAAHRLKGRR